MKTHVFLGASIVFVLVVAWLSLRKNGGTQALVADTHAETSKRSRSVELEAPMTSAQMTSDTRSTEAEARRSVASESSAIRPDTIVVYGFVHAHRATGTEDRSGVTLVDHAGKRVSVSAADDGAYSISGLEPGTYDLQAYGPPNAKAEAKLALTLNDTPKRFDITVVETPSILVRLVDPAGQPLSHVHMLAVATRTAPAKWYSESRTDPLQAGRFAGNGQPGSMFSEDVLGRIDLDEPPPVFVSVLYNQFVVATQRVECGQSIVDFVLDRGSPLLKPAQLRAHFVDVHGADVPSVSGMLDCASGGGRSLSGTATVTVPDLAPGSYRLTPTAKGFERRQIAVLLEPSEDKDLGAVTLEPEQWISGVVVEPKPSGKRLGLQCDLFDPASDPWAAWRSIMSYLGNADGSFRIPWRSRATYVLKFDDRDSEWGIWARFVDTRAGPVENVRVELQRAVPLVIRPSIDDWRSVFYKITGDDGVPYVTAHCWSANPSSLRLSPGHYDIEVRVGAAEPVHKSVTLGSDAVEIALP